MWFETLTKAIAEFFTWKTQDDSPETIRLRTIRGIDADIDRALVQMDKILTERFEDVEIRRSNEVLLALCSDTIKQLQYKRKTLTR